MRENALAHVRALLGDVNTSAIALAADLLNANRSAAEILRPLADDATPAGIEVSIAFQILEDAAAGAVPLDQTATGAAQS